MKERSLKILVTAGPTREPMDPVRYISNYSTGEMGYAIARKAVQRRHKAMLISGPSQLIAPKGVKLIKINTALEMRKEVKEHFDWCDCLIMSAAVSDYRAAEFSQSKIKSDKNTMRLNLVKNPDILKEIGKKKGRKILIGFSLESQDLMGNAVKKLNEKNLDFVVANKVEKENLPFGDRKVTAFIIDRDYKVKKISAASKDKIAGVIIGLITSCSFSAR